nr:unnamed protein product [Trichobilharzia regenti]
MGRFYLVYIILSVGVFLFSLSVFVKQIRSKSLPVCIMLEFTDILWSVCLAANLPSFNMMLVLLSLAPTVVFTLLIVVLALQLPPFNLNGVALFASVSAIFAMLSIITNVCSYLIMKGVIPVASTQIICILELIFTGLFIIFVAFTCLSGRGLMMWWFGPNSLECILAFVIWFLMMGLFSLICTTLKSCTKWNMELSCSP